MQRIVDECDEGIFGDEAQANHGWRSAWGGEIRHAGAALGMESVQRERADLEYRKFQPLSEYIQQ